MVCPYLNGKIRKVFSVFQLRRGCFGQEYYSAVFPDREVTVDDLQGFIMVCVSTPPLEEECGEVVKSWTFENEDEVIKFLQKEALLL